MKQYIYFLILILGISLTACNKDKQTQENEESTIISKPIKLNKQEFLTKVLDFENNPDKWVYLGDKPCIIDFYADWCPPCKMIEPILNELAEEYAGKIYIYKIDVDKQKELAYQFNIQSIPTLIFVPMEGMPMLQLGALEKEDFVSIIDEVLLKKE